MEVGASLVGFIGFGLTSIKTIHSFVTSIRDGPQRLQDLARALESLRAAYERTRALHDLPGILEPSPSLLKQLKQCNEDVDRFSKALVKMQMQPGDRLYSTLRKRFKLPLCEDEIKDMLGILSGHVNSFTLEISILDVRISQRNSSEISQVIAMNKHRSNLMQQHHTSLQEIRENVIRSESKIEHVQHVVDALAHKVESLPSVSTQQSALVLDMFAQLEGKFNELLFRERKMLINAPRPVNLFDIASTREDNADSLNEKVANSIRRLSALLEEKNRVTESDEAQDIIDDIETLLEQMDTAIQHIGPEGLLGRKTDFLGVEKKHRKETKRALGVLRCSPKLTINPQDWGQHRPLGGRATKSESTLARYQSRLGDWLVLTRRQWRICEAKTGDEERQEYTATIAFKPAAQGGLHHIKVSIQQLQQANGFYTFTPIVSVGRIRPSDSRVFQCVKLGLFDEFLRLLAAGEASLQDRDEVGAPLLHVSSSHTLDGVK
ncbi:hypothetical protein LX36DRAFT_659165 [Colletotrichum falcatum]|nr:hypothetical protein LX36DRAFT_659165 [Colletotrichum falcatum]